ncbi:restriction endonuclease subunit S [Desulfovibrio sp. QI0430]
MSSVEKRWKPYPEYKNSGVEWLGMVPEGWEVKRLKYIVTYNDETLPETTDEDYSFQYVDISSVGLIEGIQCMESTTFGKAPSRARRIARKGDCIVSTVRTYLKAIAPIRFDIENLIVSTGFAVIRPSVEMAPDFVKYYVQSTGFVDDVCAKSVGVSYPTINPSTLVCICCALPPLAEQQAIAAFLDLQCTQIDSLIEKKQRMLDLLDEKRRTVITQAVTRGLDPTVPMKNSGLEWLGMVPEGWEIKRLGVITQFIQTGPFGSQLHSEDYIENGTPVINPSHIQNGKIVPNYRCSIDKYNEVRLQRHKLTVGDVVFARRGEMGRCAEILSGDDGYICGTGCLQIRFKGNALSAFFASYLQTEFIRDYLKLESVGSTMDNLNTEILSKIPIPLPPLPEQQAIADYLESQCPAMDSQRKNLEKSIELLREYRASLITHAVTGKIDVRDAAPLQ